VSQGWRPTPSADEVLRPSLPTSRETLMIKELPTLRARTGACWDVAGQWARWGWCRGPGALEALERPRGRKRVARRDAEMAALRRRAERAEAELVKARRVIEVQGNVSALLGELLEPRGADPSTER